MQDGIALTKTELLEAPRHAGKLLMEEWGNSNVFGRSIRRARLISSLQGVGDIDVVAPLFEPQLMRVGNDRLTLVGHEVHASDGVPKHVVQVWLVKPV